MRQSANRQEDPYLYALIGNLLLRPLVLAADLVLLLRGKVVLDVECLADLVGRLALDHVGDSLTADVQKSLNVEVVCSLCNK